MLSQLMGAALLSVAFMVQKMGLVLSVIGYLITIGTVVFIYKAFIDATHYTGATSYRGLCEKVVGRSMSIVLEICNVIQFYGFCTSYVIISSNSIIGFVQNVTGHALNSYATKAMISGCIIFPLTLLRRLSTLAKIGTLAGLAIFITAISIVVNCFINLPQK